MVLTLPTACAHGILFQPLQILTFWPLFTQVAFPHTDTHTQQCPLCIHCKSHPIWLRLKFHFTSGLLLILLLTLFTSYTSCTHTCTLLPCIQFVPFLHPSLPILTPPIYTPSFPPGHLVYFFFFLSPDTFILSHHTSGEPSLESSLCTGVSTY